MIFSEMHDWQGDASVKQVLVFVSEDKKKEFETKLAERIEEHGLGDASDSDIGALYKLRAVKNGDGSWSGIIRDGKTGDMIAESWKTFKTPKEAMLKAMTFFEVLTINAYDEQARVIKNLQAEMKIKIESLISNFEKST